MLVLFENEEFLILEKPFGIATTSEGRGITDSVQSWLLEKYAWAKKVERAGICHRLDKQTSGILLVAKKQKDCDGLKALFKSREVEKQYVALVGGRVPTDGAVNVPIGKSHFFAKRKVIVEGKIALTYFKILRRYRDENNRDFTLLICSPKTGRTHQIRVHCSYMGWPLVGDTMYGGDRRFIQRQFLHASKLSFKYMTKDFVFESKIPADLEECLNNYVAQD